MGPSNWILASSHLVTMYHQWNLNAWGLIQELGRRLSLSPLLQAKALDMFMRIWLDNGIWDVCLDAAVPACVYVTCLRHRGSCSFRRICTRSKARRSQIADAALRLLVIPSMFPVRRGSTR
jgi:hypothetical protein